MFEFLSSPVSKWKCTGAGLKGLDVNSLFKVRRDPGHVLYADAYVTCVHQICGEYHGVNDLSEPGICILQS